MSSWEMRMHQAYRGRPAALAMRTVLTERWKQVREEREYFCISKPFSAFESAPGEQQRENRRPVLLRGNEMAEHECKSCEHSKTVSP